MFSAKSILLLEAVDKSARDLAAEVFIVGGLLRDLLLHAHSSDRDFDLLVVGADVESLAQAVQKQFGGEVRGFPQFMTAKLSALLCCDEIEELDFAHARAEIYERPGALPKVCAATLAEDLRRRDFSINTLAVRVSDFVNWVRSGAALPALSALLIDQFNGLRDLKRREIRILHEESFLDDPTRIFRACRYAARLNGSLESDTAQKLSAALAQRALSTISSVRVVNELRKLVAEQNQERGFDMLFSLGVWNALAPLAVVTKDRLAPLLQGIASLCAGWDIDERFDALLLGLLALCTDKQQREELLRFFGQGKRFLRRFERAQRAISGLSASEADRDILFLRSIIFADQEAIAEMKKRRATGDSI